MPHDHRANDNSSNRNGKPPRPRRSASPADPRPDSGPPVEMFRKLLANLITRQIAADRMDPQSPNTADSP